LLSVTLLNAINDMPIVAAFQGEHHGSFYGYSMVSLDFNHDGHDDLAVCSFAYGYNHGISPARGKIYIYYGGAGFNSATPASVTIEGTYANSEGRRIWGIYRVGDISGDGFDDLCMYVEDHISWNESYEKLLFFYGGTPNLDNPDYVLNLYGSVYTFFRILPLGDVNGDGFGDMGFYYRHTPSYQNRLSIIWGGSFQEHVVSNGEASYSYSCSINGIGDINNDGYADFTTAFATPTTDPTHNLIRLYYGNAAGNTDNPITLIYCQYGVSRGSKPLGDMNADGYDDFMGYITDEGMHAWLGGTNINYAVPDFDMDPPWYGGEFQQSLEHGDFNNDGYEDAVGANYGYRGFAVWLGKQNVNGTSDLIKYNSGYENFGYRLVTGDFNADGFDDVAIAASHEYAPQPSGNFNGYVWVYGGNAQLADTTVTNDDPMLPGIGDQLSIRLSPNPITRADQALSVNIKGSVTNGSEAVSIEIFNIKGQSVYRETHEHYSGAGKYMVNTPSLSTGIYLCKVISGKQTAISKFSVIK
ncbi:MAG: FG-GAP-like repeat-containing protein, partial [Candidatus Cloacimonetes bacterium]|nr:FG-GAP-like repeat-containing protein [Candidatus Cloacimonadota bacterium]